MGVSESLNESVVGEDDVTALINPAEWERKQLDQPRETRVAHRFCVWGEVR